MITIYICDSEESSRNTLSEYCRRLVNELHLPITAQSFSTGEEMLSNMSPGVDIVLLEAELSDMSGMECACRIRENNTSVMLIFVTALLSCAVDSYRVRATDFLPKPVSYATVSGVLTEAVQTLEQSRASHITFQTPTQWVRLPMHSILYVESARNKAVIHTLLNRYELYISMKEVEAQLEKTCFFHCHAGYIVNLANIVRIEGSTAMMIDGSIVYVSKYRKKDLIEHLGRFTLKDSESEPKNA